ncbi:telomere-protecting terminal protein Tpg [Streptomyces sp. GD-15H]|uniref:telomere-protecting terminal protein Tpg n=1 Tax=Streptomyces sp. GD-15H TaxID=3129112 RepID=UPI003873012A
MAPARWPTPSASRSAPWSGTSKSRSADPARRLQDAVRARWQPRIRERARRPAATSTDLVVDTRARLGFTAAPGTTDDARLRHLTLALPPHRSRAGASLPSNGTSSHRLPPAR